MNKTLELLVWTATPFIAIAVCILPAGCDSELTALGTENGEVRATYSKLVEGEENAVLTAPPLVPAPITRKHPTRMIVDLEVKEFTGRIADGVEYVSWAFGGSVPGSFIRVREGDEIAFNLHNHPDNRMPHNIDLHAVTGAAGGAASSFTAPGHSSRFSFTAPRPGLFVYHCATAPVGMHIANGMYGLILVEPEAGLPAVDREYYVMQRDFYTQGKCGDPGLQDFSMEKALDENPSEGRTMRFPIAICGSVLASCGSQGPAVLGGTGVEPASSPPMHAPSNHGPSTHGPSNQGPSYQGPSNQRGDSVPAEETRHRSRGDPRQTP